MAHSNARRKAGRQSPLWRPSGVLVLLSLTTGLLAACGGGGAGGGTNSVTLEWDAVTNPSPGGYRVYVGIASGTYQPFQDAGPFTTYTVTGLGSGTYYFVVTAYDMSNNESAFSNEILRILP
jgi:hypothetical protein